MTHDFITNISSIYFLYMSDNIYLFQIEVYGISQCKAEELITFLTCNLAVIITLFQFRYITYYFIFIKDGISPPEYKRRK